MSVTAEDIRARIAQASGGLTAEQVRARLAQAPGAATPVPAATNPTMEQVAASFTKPILETAEGIQSLNLEGNPLRKGLERRQAGTQEALDWAQSTQAPGAAGTGAGILGELSMMALPASKSYKLTRALTKARPVIGKVAPITAESATLGGMEALKTPEEGKTRGEVGLETFRNNLAMGAGQKLLGKALNPQMFRRTEGAKEEMEALAAAGIKPDIPITLGTRGTGPASIPAAWAIRGPAMGLPGTKRILAKQIDKATGDWRTLMAKKALPDGVDLPVAPFRSGEAPMEAQARAMKRFYKDQYKEVLDPHEFPVMGLNSPVGARMNAALSTIPGRGSQETVIEKVGDLLGAKVNAKGNLTGSAVSDLKTALRSEARLAKDGTTKKGYLDVLKAFDEGVTDSLKAMNPEHAARYQALKEPYKHFVVLDDAIGSVSKGEFQPKDLLRSGKRHARKNKINLREALYRREGQRAEDIYDLSPKTRDSNIFQIRALGNVVAGGGAGLGASMLSPLGALYTGAVTGTTAAALPRWGQKYMMGEVPYQEALSKLLRKEGIQDLSRAARIGGGQYLAE